MLQISVKAPAQGPTHHLPRADLSSLAHIQVNTRKISASEINSSRGQAPTSLVFAPSLNYLRVLGGQSNSRRQGQFSEREFLANTLAHSLWLYQQPDAYFEAHKLSPADRVDVRVLCDKLFQSQMIVELFRNQENSKYSEHLMCELAKSGHLLIHNNDRSHAFYLEIEKKHILSDKKVVCDLTFYNAGKGLGFHDRPEGIGKYDSLLPWKKNRKRHTAKIFSNIVITPKNCNF